MSESSSNPGLNGPKAKAKALGALGENTNTNTKRPGQFFKSSNCTSNKNSRQKAPPKEAPSLMPPNVTAGGENMITSNSNNKNHHSNTTTTTTNNNSNNNNAKISGTATTDAPEDAKEEEAKAKGELKLETIIKTLRSSRCEANAEQAAVAAELCASFFNKDDNIERYSQFAVELGLSSAIINLMKKHILSYAVQYNGVVILYHVFCVGSADISDFFHSGGIESTVGALQRSDFPPCEELKHVYMQSNGCELITDSIILAPDDLDHVLKAGGLDVVIKVYDEVKRTQGAVAAAFAEEAVARFVRGAWVVLVQATAQGGVPDCVVETITETECVRKVLEAMKQFPSNTTIQQSGCTFFQFLANAGQKQRQCMISNEDIDIRTVISKAQALGDQLGDERLSFRSKQASRALGYSEHQLSME